MARNPYTTITVLSIVLLSCFQMTQAKTRNKHQSDSIVAEYIRMQGIEEFVLYYCTDTLSTTLQIETKKRTYEKHRVFAYFLDEKPDTQWGHPCRYIFVSKDNGEYEVLPGTEYPLSKKENTWLVLSKKTEQVARQTNLSNSFHQKGTTFQNREGRNYAVIINGGCDRFSNFSYFLNDCKLIYKTLTSIYKYKKDDIYVLVSDGKDPEPDLSDGNSSGLDLDGDGFEDIQYAASKENIGAVFNLLSQKTTPEDHVFIFTTDHGNRINNESVLNLWYETMNPDEFAAEVNKLNAGTISIMMLQCYSGGFLPALQAENRVMVSACKADENGLGGLPCSLFLKYWISAIMGYVIDARPDAQESVNADINNDGRVSFQECFLYAEQNVIQGETPQYISIPENLGNELSLGGRCTETLISNTSINQNQTISDCNITIRDTDVKKGKKLTLNHQNAVILGPGFKMEAGSELKINPLEDW